MGRVERSRELARKRKRKAQIKKLRTEYAAAKSSDSKASILEKARKMSPFIEFEEAK